MSIFSFFKQLYSICPWFLSLLLSLILNMPRVYNWDLYHEELADMYLLHNMQLKDIMIEMST